MLLVIFLVSFHVWHYHTESLRTKIHWLSQIAAGSCCCGTWRALRAWLVQFGTEPTILLVFAISIACLDGILTLSRCWVLSWTYLLVREKKMSLQTQVVRRLVCAGVLRMNARKNQLNYTVAWENKSERFFLWWEETCACWCELRVR